MKTQRIRVKKAHKKLSSSVLVRTDSATIKGRKSDVAMSASFRHAVSDAIRKHHQNDIPVAKFDAQKGQVYYLRTDGSRTYETT